MDNENKNVKNENLGTEHRVRVLSPGLMVFKRFIRNKLAIAGTIIIICMFLFAFLGGLIVPYTQSQVFYSTDELKKDFGGAKVITDFQIVSKDGVKLPSDMYKALQAFQKKDYVFESKDGSNYGVGRVSDEAFFLYKVSEASVSGTDAAIEAARAADSNFFELNGKTYLFNEKKGDITVYSAEEVGFESKVSFTAYNNEAVSYDFMEAVLLGIHNQSTDISADGTNYTLDLANEKTVTVYAADGSEYASVSDMSISSVSSEPLTPAFKQVIRTAIDEGKESFTYADENGEDVEYFLINKNGEYTIKTYKETTVIDTYAAPSAAHWFGTDANGMDLLTRLMYGGRISLLIGFVVVFIELFIGVIVGGIAGYFGGWVDNLLMRIVDIVYCIPVMPLYLILGSVMDYYQVSPTARIYLLCVIMSIVGWVGIARIVRGQILSLREQEFMIAAEATGISVNRRIFKHLIPNVVPQLIVFATMGLGDIILTEASLSFLGLGIKYPAASWGSIINAVNDSYVMTNFWWVWIPAGILILLTVLAFNFIGDGLRDAFDPKMKR